MLHMVVDEFRLKPNHKYHIRVKPFSGYFCFIKHSSLLRSLWVRANFTMQRCGARSRCADAIAVTVVKHEIGSKTFRAKQIHAGVGPNLRMMWRAAHCVRRALEQAR